MSRAPCNLSDADIAARLADLGSAVVGQVDQRLGGPVFVVLCVQKWGTKGQPAQTSDFHVVSNGPTAEVRAAFRSMVAEWDKREGAVEAKSAEAAELLLGQLICLRRGHGPHWEFFVSRFDELCAAFLHEHPTGGAAAQFRAYCATPTPGGRS